MKAAALGSMLPTITYGPDGAHLAPPERRGPKRKPRMLALTPRPQPWQREAACRDIPEPDVFFPVETSLEAHLPALAICARCPVQATCREWADEQEGDTPASNLWGVIGGEVPRERHRRRLGLVSHRTQHLAQALEYQAEVDLRARQQQFRRALAAAPRLANPERALMAPRSNPEHGLFAPPLRLLGVGAAYTFGQVVIATGVTVRELRYWRSLDLVGGTVTPMHREDGHLVPATLRFSEQDLRRVAAIVERRRSGENLQSIRQVFPAMLAEASGKE